MGLCQSRNVAVGTGFDRIALGLEVGAGRLERAEMRDAAVGQDHALLDDVVDRLAVQHGSRAARVVGHHAADGGAARRRHVRSEAKVVRLERGVQFIEHDAGLDAGPSLVRIHLDETIQVLRGIEHEAGANRLAGLRRAAASRRDRDAVPGGNRHCLLHRFG